MATSLQQQCPLKQVPNCPNNLSTTASFFSNRWKSQEWSWNLICMTRWWLVMVMCSIHTAPVRLYSFCLQYCLIAIKLRTSKNYLHYSCILPLLFINNEWITIMGYSKHELSTISMLYSRKIIYLSYYTSTFP